uniref:Transient receptor potential cation channel, subfamily M, member 4a n=1 Tax=Gadus morhua TaxID=8049 RepID=A0A8C5FUE4_GADMO
ETFPQSDTDTPNGALCQCGGPRGTHGSNATGDYFGAAIVSQWDSGQHSSEYPTDAFGEVEFTGAGRRHSHFLRLSRDTPPQIVFTLMTAHWGVPSPNLVVSVVGGGGEGQEKVKPWVREVMRNGLVRAAQSTGAWILTGGLREGVGRCVGEAVRDHAAAAPSLSQKKVVAVGVAPWGLVHNRQQLVNAQGSFPARYYVQNTSQDTCGLDSNYQAFLLVDDGTVGQRGGETGFLSNLEDYISHQRTGIWGEKLKRVASHASEYTEELKLAVAWNRVDIAKSELFNGDIHWKYEDLEDSMTDALVNDKPQFVRLFCENGLNILHYLSYSRLESLYRSLADSSLAYTLLQRRLAERQAAATSLTQLDGADPGSPVSAVTRLMGSASAKELCLYEVSRLSPCPLLLGDCLYRDQRCLSPWASLFIWAVLQNRSEMAVYFWEMASESVLSALSGCKILRELSKLEDETESKVSMKELAQKFENLAQDVFSSCYQSNERRCFTLLIRQSPVWAGATCLQMATAADARLFFSHDGVQTLLSQIWWGSSSPPIRPFAIQRWRNFWFAPVTSFLGNVLMYFLFLCLFAYVLLVDFKGPPPKGPSISEMVLYFWVFTMVCEEIRQTFFVGSTTVIQRMKTYIQDIWNKCDLTAITVFALAVACRMFDESYHFGRALMALDFMVFTLRLIHIFAIHKQLGPKIIIVSKMMKDVFFFLFFLFVWLMAYGVANQALLYSYDPRPSWIFRRVFYRPYLHIFGQIPINEMDADKLLEVECTNNRTLIEGGMEPCMDGSYNWLVVLLLVVYLLVTNILLINLLIAMFSYTFSKVQDHSDTHWKFQRYNLIVEYHSRPCLAPPFIILSHLHLFIKRFVRRIPSAKVKHFAASRLNTWEGLQKENLLSAQNKRLRDSDTARLKRTSVKVDTVLKQMSEIRDRDRRLRLLESEVSVDHKDPHSGWY